MKELSAKEYQKSAKPTSFMQTTQMAKQRQVCGQTIHFFQYQDQFALMNGTPYPHKTAKYYNYTIWFPDQLSSSFIKQLHAWCKRHKGLSLTITPNTPTSIRNNHGEIIQKIAYDKTIFLDNHFKWQGLILTAPGTYKQWQYIIELNRPHQQLLESFKPKVRHCITTTIKTGLIIEKLTPKNLEAFAATLATTADRRHFSARDHQYYQSLLNAFEGDAYGLIAYLNPTKTRQLLQSTIKNSQHVKDGADIIKKAQRQLKIIQDLKQRTPIYAGFFVDTPRETVYLAGGGPDQYFPFSPVYAILDQAMQRSAKKHIPRFNLYGVDATFSHPTGLLKFKQQYNGFIEQLPGDYTANFRTLTAITLKAKNRLKM